MNKSQRILINSNDPIADSHVIVKLDQDVDTLEFLSMSLSVNDVYQNFNADYGVLVGRVLANGGVGIPNARISIFIPLADEDINNGEITSIYPYVNPTDKNNDGKRYNLLPRVSQIDPNTGIATPKQPFGSFPIKPELVTNVEFLDVYKKYYKYTALTNGAGDYMIFGAPVGTQTVHLSVDITDIGKYSMTPAAMVTNLGYSPNLFTDNNSKIKPSNDLGDLPNIETQEISVDIVPFWGDSENFTIGITRQDFRIRSVLTNTFTIFGTAFTDGIDSMWGTNSFDNQKINELYTVGGGDEAFYRFSISSKRIGIISEKVYYYPANVSDADINSGNVDPKTQMLVLDPTEYSIYKRDGDFVFIVSCNRNKIITDEFGNETPVSENSVNGIYTKFRGFITLEITTESIPMNWVVNGDKQTFEPIRTILKFPQSATNGNGLSPDDGTGSDTNNENWRKQHYTFSGGSIYSIAAFNGTVYMGSDAADNDNAKAQGGSTAGASGLVHYSSYDHVNVPYNLALGRDSGVILTNDTPDITGNNTYEMVSNSIFTLDGVQYKVFGANWLNLCIYLPQIGFVSNGYAYVEDWRSNTNFQNWQYNKKTYYYVDNLQAIAAGEFNTKWYARTDLHWTDFISVPKTDIIAMANVIPKGFTSNAVVGLGGQYRNGANVSQVPINGGKLNGNFSNGQDPVTYFYKGFKDANCIDFIISLGLV